MIGLKADTIEQYEQLNAEIVNLLGLNCRYCGRENQPDIVLVGGGYGIPYPNTKEHQEQLKDFNWQEVEIIVNDELV